MFVLQMRVVLTRQAVEVQRLADVCFDPIGELGIARRPAHEPRLQILLGLFESAPVVEPAQLLTTIVVGLAGQRVEGIAEDVHVTPLPHGLGQELPHRPLESGMVVGDENSTPWSPRVLRLVTKVVQLERDFDSRAPRPGFGVRPSPLIPIAMTACDWITPSSRTFSYRASRIR